MPYILLNKNKLMNDGGIFCPEIKIKIISRNQREEINHRPVFPLHGKKLNIYMLTNL